MDIALSIEMVIWVAVGGRGTLVGAIVGALAVNIMKTLLSEKFPEVWNFFQGGLFLLVVTVLPDGVIGWFRSGGLADLLGTRKLSTYPQVALDESVRREQDSIGSDPFAK
jgi:urea transport system permease protein